MYAFYTIVLHAAEWELINRKYVFSSEQETHKQQPPSTHVEGEKDKERLLMTWKHIKLLHWQGEIGRFLSSSTFTYN